MSLFDDDYWDESYPVGHSKNINAPEGVHIMNKNESSMLRKLKSKTGLTEVELRKEKKYRVILSEAQKVKSNKTPLEKELLNIQKSITKLLKLPKEHPLVLEALKNKFDNIKRNSFEYGIIKIYSNQELFRLLNNVNKKMKK